jgi:hypothetical protein
MKAKVVTDKHLDGAAIGRVLGRFVMSAASHKPTNKHPYRGKHQDDEDYTEVLQLAWENECPLLTGDAAMIEKAREFRLQFPKVGEERCLRGVIILPTPKGDQLRVLERFQAGKIELIRSGSGHAIPQGIDDVETFNVGIDLRKNRPKVVWLCDCGD